MRAENAVATSVIPFPAMWCRGAAIVPANELGAAVFAQDDGPLGLVEPADLVLWQAAAERCRTSQREVITVRSAGPGPRRFFEITLVPADDLDVLALVYEVTEAVRADAALYEVVTGMYIADENLIGRWMPRKLALRLGIDPATFVGVDLYNYIHLDDREVTRTIVSRAIETPGMTCAAFVRISQPLLPAVYQPVIVTVRWLAGDDAIAGLVVRLDTGIDAETEIDAIGRRNTDGLLTYSDSSATGFLNLALDGRVVWRSSRFIEILRSVGIDDRGQTWASLVRSEDRAVVAEIIDAVPTGQHKAAEIGFAGRGNTVWCRLDVLPYRNDLGEVAGAYLNLLDVTVEHEATTALATAREELHHLASHDALTGLWNRVPFGERLSNVLTGDTSPAADVRGTGLLVCDLDCFKAINDDHGHVVGDEVLSVVGHRLKAAIREGDVVCRFGGDEFLVLCERIDATGLAAVAEHVVAALREPIDVEGTTVHPGVSVGVHARAGWRQSRCAHPPSRSGDVPGEGARPRPGRRPAPLAPTSRPPPDSPCIDRRGDRVDGLSPARKASTMTRRGTRWTGSH